MFIFVGIKTTPNYVPPKTCKDYEIHQKLASINPYDSTIFKEKIA